jgi:hypothetical protein
VPQLPQFCALAFKSTQTPAQAVIPVGQAHWPFWQTRFPPQVCWQKPQLLLSVCRSTQELLQRASPEPQLTSQAPSLQTSPGLQRLPQLPQF